MKQLIVISLLFIAVSCKKEDNQEPKKLFIKNVNGSIVTIKNGAEGIQDITAWTIGDADNPTAFTIDSGTFLNQQAQLSYTASQMGITIESKGETIFLKNNFGNTIDTFEN